MQAYMRFALTRGHKDTGSLRWWTKVICRNRLRRFDITQGHSDCGLPTDQGTTRVAPRGVGRTTCLGWHIQALFKIKRRSSRQSTGCSARVSGFTVSTAQVPETWRGHDHLRHTHVVPSPQTSSGCSARVSGFTVSTVQVPETRRGRDHLRHAPAGCSVLTFYFKTFGRTYRPVLHVCRGHGDAESVNHIVPKCPPSHRIDNLE